MVTFCVRFDFRNPPLAGTTMVERYRAGLDMIEWADRLGALNVILSEHHGSGDGYLPSALTMASAAAARTSQLRIMVAAVVAPLHDPIRLAEQAAVVDLISGGRLDLVLVNGYVAREFEMAGCPMNERARRTADAIDVLRHAFTGEPFEHHGRWLQVTPAPTHPGGPPILLGGSTEPAARRAARMADGFLPSTPAMWDFYRDELARFERLEHVSHRSGGTCALDERSLALAEGDDQDVVLVEYPAGCLDPVDPGQREIHQDQVRSMLARQPDRLLAVTGAGAHVEAGVLECQAQVGPHDRIVVDREHTECGEISQRPAVRKSRSELEHGKKPQA